MNNILPTYNRIPINFEKGQGYYLFDENNKKYLDFNSGIGVNALGHNHPDIIKTITNQAKKIMHCSNMFEIKNASKLAKKLSKITFADNVFFANSGAEAVECALKMARIYDESRHEIIAMKGAFHGRTIATSFAGGQEKHIKGFEPALEGFKHIEFNNIKQLEESITDKTCAILLEPVQGEAGALPANKAFLEKIKEISIKKDILIIFDEVQCGMGRTGFLFDYMSNGVKPDILTSAKGLGAGFPIGACLATKKASRGMTVGKHGSTYGGNPLATAVANKAVEIISNKDFLKNVQKNSQYLKKMLNQLTKERNDIFESFRGKGLMIGLKCANDIPNKIILDKLIENNMICARSKSDYLRLLPPLIIDEQGINEAYKVLSSIKI